MKKCCRTCEYHIYEDYTQGHVCCNDRSEHVADWTDDDHVCDEWEERDEDEQTN